MEDRFTTRGSCIYDRLQNQEVASYEIIAQMMNELYKVVDKTTQKIKPILLIEDGSVDFDEIEEKGINDNYTVIIYRQDSNKPEVLKYE